MGIINRYFNDGRARSTANVGLPRWSFTTRISSLSLKKRSMVCTKFGLFFPYSHAVRMIKWPGTFLTISSSPPSLLLPYTPVGRVLSSSVYGASFSPSKT
jgi:hypothetical protein